MSDLGAQPHPNAWKNALGRVPFADLGQTGRAALWRYGLGILLVVGLGYGLASALLQLAGPLGAQDAIDALDAAGSVQDWARLDSGTALAVFVLRSVTLIAFMPGVFLAVTLLHGRSLESVLTARPEFAWSLMWASFGVMAVLLGLAASALHFLGYEVLSPNFGTERFLLFLPFIILLGPLEILSSEMIFRGYLTQFIGRLTGIFTLRVLIPGFLFAAAQIYYIGIAAPALPSLLGVLALGVFLTMMAIRGDGLEACFGMHLAVNWFALMAVGAAASAHPEVQAAFVTEPDALASSVALFVILVVHTLIMSQVFARRRRKRGQ